MFKHIVKVQPTDAQLDEIEQGEIETQPIYGDRVVTMSRDDVAAFLAAHPGAVELE